jgi:hypothetical protein
MHTGRRKTGTTAEFGSFDIGRATMEGEQLAIECIADKSAELARHRRQSAGIKPV